jgi:hypothetical protein
MNNLMLIFRFILIIYIRYYKKIFIVKINNLFLNNKLILMKFKLQKFTNYCKLMM